MNEPKTFRVSWQTGYIEVNVSNFFGSSNQREINKLLKLARVYCTDVQRIALLSDLKEAKQGRIEAIVAMAALGDQMQELAVKAKDKQKRTEAVSAMDALLLQMRKLAEPFFTRKALSTTRDYGKAMIKQRDRIEYCIKKITSENWKAA